MLRKREEEEAVEAQCAARVSSTESSGASTVPEPVLSGVRAMEDEWMSWPSFEELVADGLPASHVLGRAPEIRSTSPLPVCYHAEAQTEQSQSIWE